MSWHGYISVDELNLTAPQWASIQSQMEILGETAGPTVQPAHICHWRKSGQSIIYEASFADGEITVEAFKNYLATAMGVGVGTITDATVNESLVGETTPVVTLTQGGSGRIKFAWFAGTASTWENSWLAVIEFVKLAYEQTAYFVDAANGDDAFDGRTPWRAFQTIATAIGVPPAAGNQILLKADAEWREQLAIPSNGSAASPIVYGAYGAGNKPRLNGTNLITTWAQHSPNRWQAALVTEPGIVLFDETRGTEETAILNLSAANEWFWAANVLYVFSVGDPDTEYTNPGIEASIRMGFYLNNDDHIIIQDIEVYGSNAQGIQLTGGASDIIIDGCSLTKNYDAGIQCNTLTAASNDVVVRNCTTRYNGGSGIAPGRYAIGWTIENNDCQYDNQLEGNEAGIKAWGLGQPGTGNHVIQNNICKNTAAGGYGIWVDEMPVASIVRYNVCQDNDQGGLVLEKCSGNQVYYNILIGGFVGIEIIGTGATPADGNVVYNNVVYDTASYGINVQGDGNAGAIVDNLIRNNAVYTGGTRELRAVGGGENDGINGSGNVYTKNCWGPEAVGFIEWGAAILMDTYAAWEAAYGSGTNSVEEIPGWADAATEDFTLTVGSGCRDAGADVGLTEDYNGVSVPQETNPSVGAYEYV